MTDLIAILSRLTDWQNIVDLFLLMLIFYALLHLLRGTQAAQLVLGILIIGILVFVLVRTVELTAFSWLLRNSSLVVFVSIPVRLSGWLSNNAKQYNHKPKASALGFFCIL